MGAADVTIEQADAKKTKAGKPYQRFKADGLWYSDFRSGSIYAEGEEWHLIFDESQNGEYTNRTVQDGTYKVLAVQVQSSRTSSQPTIRDASIARAVALKGATELAVGQGHDSWEPYAETMLAWLMDEQKPEAVEPDDMPA